MTAEVCAARKGLSSALVRHRLGVSGGETLRFLFVEGILGEAESVWEPLVDSDGIIDDGYLPS